MLNSLRKANSYSKLDITGAYHLLWVKVENEHYLTFRTHYDPFGPTVMQFGTTNDPADFQGYITVTIR
jgi:hypothetical protein